MAAILGLTGFLTKSTAATVFYKPDTHGSAQFAGLADARKGKLLTGKGLILGRKHGRMLRYRGEGHLLTFPPTRSGKGVGCVVPFRHP
jgi:type IV secretion system protein VirD4